MRVITGSLTGGDVIISIEDAAFLWKEGCYGSSPQRDIRKSPEYGVLSIHEALYLLKAEFAEFCFKVEKAGQNLTARELVPEGDIQRRQVMVYEELRRRSWIVQSGLNYGADFLLYRKSPEVEHAPYAVVVKSDSCTKFAWREAIALNRVATTARKRLIIAFANIDAEGGEGEREGEGEGEEEEEGKVRFLHLSRWVPEVDRQSKGNKAD